jgi:hypothetical protein
MQPVAIAAIVLVAICGATNSAHAQNADSCKECREFQRACVKAHSQSACKTDYDVCMKHCRQK